MRSNRLQAQLVFLLTLTVLCVGIGVANLLRRQTFAAPGDGVLWIERDLGLEAQAFEPGGSGTTAGLQQGDVLIAVDGQPVRSTEDVARHLYATGVGGSTQYQVLRRGSLVALTMQVGTEPRPATVRAFLEIAGVIYLLLGLFVLWRRPQARRAMHFYLYCLASFALFFLSYTGQFDALDWSVYWTSVLAMLVQPALFAHFCLSYAQPQDRDQTGSSAGRWLWLLYGSAGLLAVLHLGAARGFVRSAASLSELRWLIDRLETGYLVAMYSLGIGLLAWAYRTASSRLIAKQRLWLLGSAAAGLGPFTVFYGIPYFLGTVPSPWMNLSALSLTLLPLGMAYTVARYRLLDVEVVLRRGTAYSLATAALVGLYLGVVALAGDFFRQNFPAVGTLGLVLAVIATGLLFQPLQRWIQLRVDRYFLRRRYDYREALLRLGRQLSTQTNLDHMISSLLKQLAETLQIERAALFVRSDAVPGAWVLRGSVGLDSVRRSAAELDLGYLNGFEKGFSPSAAQRERLFFPDWGSEVAQALGPASHTHSGWQEAIRRLGLNYYFPCRTASRLTAALALGRTSGGELLLEEDVALIELLAGYVGAALENVSLFESLAAKAKQYENLQQFSENILESINVGLIAVDLEDRVQSVNTPLELMYPLPFRQCRGRRLEEIFSGELMAEISRSREDAGIRTLYRHRVQLEGGQEKVLNIAIAPLLSKNCEWIGRLMIFDDVTDRVTLEAQLAQAEKLSSIGLLAAGVAHEVNTPLTVISTQAQMLAKQMPREDTNFRTVEKIIRQTFRASEIVNSLLNFSRTKGAAFAPVEINQIIQDTLLLLDHQLKSARIAVERHLEPGLPLIQGNADKLQQVFLNMFLNAKDAMPEGGQLRITSWTEDSRVRIEIRDTGVGISPEHLRRIYDPFFTTKEPGRGTGLGLAVSYGIIHEHAGRIQAESRPGLGTRFELQFPVLRKPVHA